MIIRKAPLLLLVLGIFAIAPTSWAQSPEGELKKRFEERFATLLELKDQGRVGETLGGFVAAVSNDYLGQKIGKGPFKSDTVSDFLAKENADRRLLYEQIAEKSGVKWQMVGERNARRLFEKGSPEHYFLRSDGRWLKKKDW